MSYNFSSVRDAKVALTIAATLHSEAKKWEQHAHKITHKPVQDMSMINENKNLLQAIKYCIKKNVDNSQISSIADRFDVPEQRLEANLKLEHERIKRHNRKSILLRIYGLRDRNKKIREIARITKLSKSVISLHLRQRKLRTAADKHGLQMTKFASMWRKRQLTHAAMEMIVESDIVFRWL